MNCFHHPFYFANSNTAAKPLIQPPQNPQGQACTSSSPDPTLVPAPLIFKEESSPVEDASANNGKGGQVLFKQKRKMTSKRNRDRKKRLNQKWRKLLLPKNALMAFNELNDVSKSDFTISSSSDGKFLALVTFNSKQYQGKGLSKLSAKNVACEHALRDYMIEKMKPSTVADPMDIDGSDPNSTEDELPIVNLTSFALYKLFEEWNRAGHSVPAFLRISSNEQPQQGDGNTAVPPVRTELPPDWQNMHPVSLLYIMRPGISLVDNGNADGKPFCFNASIFVNNQTFTANGHSKKIARYNVAVKACNKLYGTNFELN